jgi:hypothetical protein
MHYEVIKSFKNCNEVALPGDGYLASQSSEQKSKYQIMQ